MSALFIAEVSVTKTVPPEDEELIARFLREEPEAIRQIEEWIARAAWPFQRRLGAQWEDVLQDARLEITLLLRQNKFRGQSSLRTYLARVVSNTCIDRLRAQSKWQWTDLEPLLERPADATPSPLQQLLRKESEQLLWQVLALLPEECRALWEMIGASLSYRQIGERLGVLEGALRVRSTRCRKKAAALLEELTRKKS
jgi:RNA polymerase sigma-70 factor, ECF subfamily